MDIAKAVEKPRGTHSKKRVGRGTSSGHGKTSGRGHKGQNSRSSVSVKALAEGGQRPLFRRIPKRGFNNERFKTYFALVNISDLQRFEPASRVDEKALREAGLVRGRGKSVKILGTGELDRALTVVAAAFSESAKRKITDAGGTVEVA